MIFNLQGIWYKNVASIVTHNRVETYLSHMENPWYQNLFRQNTA